MGLMLRKPVAMKGPLALASAMFGDPVAKTQEAATAEEPQADLVARRGVLQVCINAGGRCVV